MSPVSINHIMTFANNINDLEFVEKFFTEQCQAPMPPNKDVLTNLQRLFGLAANTPTPSISHVKGLQGIFKYLQNICHYEGASWEHLQDDFVSVLNSCTTYCTTYFEVGEDVYNHLLDDILKTIKVANRHIFLKEKLLECLSPFLLDTILNKNLPLALQLDCMKIHSILLSHSDHERRKHLLEKVHNKLARIFDLLYICGNHETQTSIVELLRRFVTRDRSRKMFLEHFKHKDPEVIRKFLSISANNFEVECRNFLNFFNDKQGENTRVFSISCHYIYLEDTQLEKWPVHDEFWIDFNLGALNMTMCCAKHSLMLHEEFVKNEMSFDWQALTVPSSIVNRIDMRTEEDDSHRITEIVLYLNENLPGVQFQCANARTINVGFTHSPKVDMLTQRILPAIFKNTEIQIRKHKNKNKKKVSDSDDILIFNFVEINERIRSRVREEFFLSNDENNHHNVVSNLDPHNETTEKQKKEIIDKTGGSNREEIVLKQRRCPKVSDSHVAIEFHQSNKENHPNNVSAQNIPKGASDVLYNRSSSTFLSQCPQEPSISTRQIKNVQSSGHHKMHKFSDGLLVKNTHALEAKKSMQPDAVTPRSGRRKNSIGLQLANSGSKHEKLLKTSVTSQSEEARAGVLEQENVIVSQLSSIAASEPAPATVVSVKATDTNKLSPAGSESVSVESSGHHKRRKFSDGLLMKNTRALEAKKTVQPGPVTPRSGMRKNSIGLQLANSGSKHEKKLKTSVISKSKEARAGVLEQENVFVSQLSSVAASEPAPATVVSVKATDTNELLPEGSESVSPAKPDTEKELTSTLARNKEILNSRDTSKEAAGLLYEKSQVTYEKQDSSIPKEPVNFLSEQSNKRSEKQLPETSTQLAEQPNITESKKSTVTSKEEDSSVSAEQKSMQINVLPINELISGDHLPKTSKELNEPGSNKSTITCNDSDALISPRSKSVPVHEVVSVELTPEKQLTETSKNSAEKPEKKMESEKSTVILEEGDALVSKQVPNVDDLPPEEPVYERFEKTSTILQEGTTSTHKHSKDTPINKSKFVDEQLAKTSKKSAEQSEKTGSEKSREISKGSNAATSKQTKSLEIIKAKHVEKSTCQQNVWQVCTTSEPVEATILKCQNSNPSKHAGSKTNTSIVTVSGHSDKNKDKSLVCEVANTDQHKTIPNQRKPEAELDRQQQKTKDHMELLKEKVIPETQESGVLIVPETQDSTCNALPDSLKSYSPKMLRNDSTVKTYSGPRSCTKNVSNQVSSKECNKENIPVGTGAELISVCSVVPETQDSTCNALPDSLKIYSPKMLRNDSTVKTYSGPRSCTKNVSNQVSSKECNKENIPVGTETELISVCGVSVSGDPAENYLHASPKNANGKEKVQKSPKKGVQRNENTMPVSKKLSKNIKASRNNQGSLCKPLSPKVIVLENTVGKNLRKRKPVNYVVPSSPSESECSSKAKQSLLSSRAEPRRNENTLADNKKPNLKKRLFAEKNVEILSLSTDTDILMRERQIIIENNENDSVLSENQFPEEHNEKCIEIESSLDEFDKVKQTAPPPLQKKLSWSQKYLLAMHGSYLSEAPKTSFEPNWSDYSSASDKYVPEKISSSRYRKKQVAQKKKTQKTRATSFVKTCKKYDSPDVLRVGNDSDSLPDISELPTQVIEDKPKEMGNAVKKPQKEQMTIENNTPEKNDVLPKKTIITPSAFKTKENRSEKSSQISGKNPEQVDKLDSFVNHIVQGECSIEFHKNNKEDTYTEKESNIQDNVMSEVNICLEEERVTLQQKENCIQDISNASQTYNPLKETKRNKPINPNKCKRQNTGKNRKSTENNANEKNILAKNNQKKNMIFCMSSDSDFKENCIKRKNQKVTRTSDQVTFGESDQNKTSAQRTKAEEKKETLFVCLDKSKEPENPKINDLAIELLENMKNNEINKNNVEESSKMDSTFHSNRTRQCTDSDKTAKSKSANTIGSVSEGSANEIERVDPEDVRNVKESGVTRENSPASTSPDSSFLQNNKAKDYGDTHKGQNSFILHSYSIHEETVSLSAVLQLGTDPESTCTGTPEKQIERLSGQAENLMKGVAVEDSKKDQSLQKINLNDSTSSNVSFSSAKSACSMSVPIRKRKFSCDTGADCDDSDDSDESIRNKKHIRKVRKRNHTLKYTMKQQVVRNKSVLSECHTPFRKSTPLSSQVSHRTDIQRHMINIVGHNDGKHKATSARAQIEVFQRNRLARPRFGEGNGSSSSTCGDSQNEQEPSASYSVFQRKSLMVADATICETREQLRQTTANETSDSSDGDEKTRSELTDVFKECVKQIYSQNLEKIKTFSNKMLHIMENKMLNASALRYEERQKQMTILKQTVDKHVEDLTKGMQKLKELEGYLMKFRNELKETTSRHASTLDEMAKSLRLMSEIDVSPTPDTKFDEDFNVTAEISALQEEYAMQNLKDMKDRCRKMFAFGALFQ